MIPTAEAIARGNEILGEIETLSAELRSLFGSPAAQKAPAARRGRPPGRLAKFRGIPLPLPRADLVEATTPRAKPERKRKMSAEGRERIAAAARARWAKYKSEKKS